MKPTDSKAKKETFDVMGDYVFSEVEKQQLAQDLAQESLKVQALGDEKTAVMSNFKAKIDQAQANVNLMATHLSQGKKQAFFKCTLEFNWETKMRVWTEVDTGRIVKKEPMRTEDFQLRLPVN